MTRAAWFGLVLLALGIGFGIGRWDAGPRPAADDDAPATARENAADGRKVLYWYDPMRPDQHFPAPGKSPFMDMPLQPKYADDGDDASDVRIDPAIASNLGVRLTTVTAAPLPALAPVPGIVQWNERAVAVVQTRAAGFVTRVFDRAPGDVLARGAPIAELQIPEWAGLQAEYLALKAAGEPALARASRARLALRGVPAEVIAAAERSGHAIDTIRVLAPIAGVVTSLDVRRGMRLDTGQTLATINGVDPIWIEAAWPVARSHEVAPGTDVSVSFDGRTEEPYTGRVDAVLPAADSLSRTLRVRVVLANPQGTLRPGLLAHVAPAAIHEHAVLQVPDSAVLRTGQRTLVFVAGDDGRYRATDVRLGQSAGDLVEVLDGLSAGQRIVASGQFLIDSEARLGSALDEFDAATPAPSAAEPLVEAEGVIEAVEDGALLISHAPIPALGWGAMTMRIALAPTVEPGDLSPGDHVRFFLRQGGETPVIARIEREVHHHD